MKKTEIRVTIDSEEKQQRAIEILERYGEKKAPTIWWNNNNRNLLFDDEDNEWLLAFSTHYRTEITLDELEELLKSEK